MKFHRNAQGNHQRVETKFHLTAEQTRRCKGWNILKVRTAFSKGASGTLMLAGVVPDDVAHDGIQGGFGAVFSGEFKKSSLMSNQSKLQWLVKLPEIQNELAAYWEWNVNSSNLSSANLEIFLEPIGRLRLALHLIVAKAATFRSRGSVFDLGHSVWVILKKALKLFQREGLTGLRFWFKHQVHQRGAQSLSNYPFWVKRFDTLTTEDFARMKAQISEFPHTPKFSVLMPTFNSPEIWLRKVLDSVVSQVYPFWELCIADDASTLPHVKRILQEYCAKDSRIHVKYRTENGHIARASQTALEMCQGDFVVLLDHDDELAPHALYELAREALEHPSAEFIYSDEDKITESGERYDPHFKPDWNPDLFYSYNYICHLAAIKTDLLKAVGGFREGFEGSQDYDLFLRVSEKLTGLGQIRHIPRILYHWRAISGSAAADVHAKSYAASAGIKAVQSHFERMSINARVEPGFLPYHRVRYPLPKTLPRVTAVICTRDRVELLRTVVEGLLLETDYPALELLIVNNQSKEEETLKYFSELKQREPSRVKVLSYDHPFNFSAMNNWGVSQTESELIAILNNDLEVVHPDWLSEMVSHALRPEVGCVGAKLYYPNQTIQHAGVILGVDNIAGHAWVGAPKNDPGYFARAKVTQSLSAVTAACMVMRKSVFSEVGGFDEKNLPVAFNDIDLCMRIREKQYQVIWTPFAELIHHESATRGSDATPENLPRFRREVAYMREHWQEKLFVDPFYNPNLNLKSGDFTLAFPPRVRSCR